MKYGLDVATIGELFNPKILAELASEAEDAGWDGFFLWDCFHAYSNRLVEATDPWIALSAIAMVTKRIRIGTMVTPLARRRPWKLARETVALDHLSNGRLVLGIGLGFRPEDFSNFGEDADPRVRGEKLDEALEVLIGLWSGERFSYHGKYYRVEDVQFLPKPVQSPRIPIWVAGFWPNRRPFRRAAKWDGVYPGAEGTLKPWDLKTILAYIRRHREPSKPFDVLVFGYTPNDPEKGARIVDPYIEAGATWWAEGTDYEHRTVKGFRERIRSGPPKP